MSQKYQPTEDELIQKDALLYDGDTLMGTIPKEQYRDPCFPSLPTLSPKEPLQQFYRIAEGNSSDPLLPDLNGMRTAVRHVGVPKELEHLNDLLEK